MNLLLIAVGMGLCLSMLSCKKENPPLQPPVSTAAKPFEVQGVKPVLIQQYPFGGPPMASQFWTIIYNKGVPKRVELSLAGLPAGLSESLSVRGGYPDFGTDFVLTSSGVPAGNYAAELLATGAGDAAPQRYPIPIEIRGTTSCADYFAGLTATTVSPCLSGSLSNYTITFSRPDPNKDTLLMHNFLNDGRALKVVFNCNRYDASGTTLVSEPQNFGDTLYQISGKAIVESIPPLKLPTRLMCTVSQKLPASSTLGSCAIQLNIQP